MMQTNESLNRIRGNVRKRNLAHPLVLALVLSSCALDSPATSVSVRVPDLSGDRSRSVQPAGSQSFLNLGGGIVYFDAPTGMTPPTSTSNLSCLGLMVTASDIEGIAPCGKNYKPQVASNMPPKPGLWGGLIDITGGRIDMKVPSGSGRRVQLVGLQSTKSPVCQPMDKIIQDSLAKMAAEATGGGGGGGHDMSDPIELATQTIDIFSDTTVTLKAQFPSNLDSKVVFKCDGGGGSSLGDFLRSINGLKLYLSADSLKNFANGSLVTSWPDDSGNGHPATAPGSYEPTVTTGGLVSGGVGSPGGYPVLHFSGAQYLYTGADPSLNGLQQRSVFAVASFAANAYYTVYSEAFSSGATGASGNLLGFQNMSGNNPKGWVATSGGTYVNSSTGTIPGPGWHVYSLIWRSGGYVELYIDGVSQGSAGGANATPTGHIRTVIGADGNLTQIMNGDIAEVIMYDHEVAPTERTDIECRLKSKFGLGSCP